MKLISLSQGKHAMVDDEDYDFLMQWKWYARIAVGGYASYAVAYDKRSKSCSLLMHRLIMKTPKGLVVDHLDFNGLNNQKYNLRNCTQKENNRRLNPARKNKRKYNGINPISLNISINIGVCKIFDEICESKHISMRGQAALLIEQFVENERTSNPVKK
jgi:hypothetical protein